MCEFCENIDEMHVIEDGYFKGQYLPTNNKNQIVKDGDKFHIWSDGGGDCFQCEICVEDIKFCPVCGRKLTETEEWTIMDLAKDSQSSEKKIKRDLFRNFKPTDCKHCYGASAGVMGVHYSCDCEKSKMYCSYPLIMCPQDCEFYEKGKEE